jgi:hypothetical protein
MGLLSAAAKAAKAAKKSKVGVRTKDVPAKTKAAMEEAEQKLKAAAEKSKVSKNEAAAKVVEKKGSVAKKMTVSATDIKQANTANELAARKREVMDMPDGNIKTALLKMIKAQEKKFRAMQAAEKDLSVRKSTQAASDRKEFKGYTPSSPFAKGGLTKPAADQTGLKKLPTTVRNKMGYMKRGGKVTKGHVDMRKGGLFY